MKNNMKPHKYLGTGEIILLLSIFHNNNSANVKQIVWRIQETIGIEHKPAHIYTTLDRLIEKGLLNDRLERNIRTFEVTDKGKEELMDILNKINKFDKS